MIEIRKEIVNAIGNVQHTEHVAFVDCFIDAILNEFSWYYNKLAQAETKKYTLRGQDIYVRYIFKSVEVKSLDKAILCAEVKAKEVITDCNNYIRHANRAYMMSNKRRGIKDKSLAIKEITLADLAFSKNDTKYCVVVYNEK